MEDGEDGDARAGAERHREDGDRGERGPPPQAPGGDAKILKKSLHRSSFPPSPRGPRPEDGLDFGEPQSNPGEKQSKDLTAEEDHPQEPSSA